MVLLFVVVRLTSRDDGLHHGSKIKKSAHNAPMTTSDFSFNAALPYILLALVASYFIYEIIY